jgi:hypothetical protein
MTNYFLSHGVSDPSAAQHQAIVALGNIVKRQALIMGFSDTFALIGVVLAVAAVALLFARKVKVGAAGGGAHLPRWHEVGDTCEAAAQFRYREEREKIQLRLQCRCAAFPADRSYPRELGT